MGAKLNGTRVLVTGASSGLGKQCALTFASHGAVVVIVARRRSKLAALKREIARNKGRAIAMAADLADGDEIERVSLAVERELGGIDVLINNAGVYCGDLPIVETDLEIWNSVVNTNLRAPYLLCQFLVPGMVKRRFGRVVNVTSATNTLVGVGAFRISKIGLEVMTAVLASELHGTGVTATAFNPGWMKTETCISGTSPKGPARALVELIQLAPQFVNGSFIDFECIGRGYRLSRRKPGLGKFGF